MTATLISANNHIGVLAVLLGVTALGFASERTPIGRRLSGALVVLIGAAVLGNLKVIPTTAPVYGVIWSVLVPLAIALYLIKADVIRIAAEGGRVLLAFAFGAIGAVGGALGGAWLLDLGPNEAEAAGVFSATYTGGSLNFAAVADAIGFRDASELAAMVAIDNVLGIGYFLLLSFVGAWTLFQTRFAWRSETLGDGPDQAGQPDRSFHEINPVDIATSLFVAAATCALGFAVADVLGASNYRILFATVTIIVVATLARRWLARLHSSELIAAVFMYLFFAILGAGADVGAMLGVKPALFIFVLMIFGAHVAATLFAARLFKLNYAECVIASAACIGGPPIAIAFAVLFGWRSLAAPAVATGVLGYVVGNFIGIGVFELLAGATR